MKRLTEKDWKDKCEGYPWNVHPVKDIDDLPYYKKLAAYEDAEEQGWLLRLPCKVGDTVYKVDRVSNKIKQHKVVKFEVVRAVDQVDFENFDYCFLHHFGKTVFLTKSEAEAKLKEMI